MPKSIEQKRTEAAERQAKYDKIPLDKRLAAAAGKREKEKIQEKIKAAKEAPK